MTDEDWPEIDTVALAADMDCLCKAWNTIQYYADQENELYREMEGEYTADEILQIVSRWAPERIEAQTQYAITLSGMPFNDWPFILKSETLNGKFSPLNLYRELLNSAQTEQDKKLVQTAYLAGMLIAHQKTPAEFANGKFDEFAKENRQAYADQAAQGDRIEEKVQGVPAVVKAVEDTESKAITEAETIMQLLELTDQELKYTLYWNHNRDLSIRKLAQDLHLTKSKIETMEPNINAKCREYCQRKKIPIAFQITHHGKKGRRGKEHEIDQQTAKDWEAENRQ